VENIGRRIKIIEMQLEPVVDEEGTWVGFSKLSNAIGDEGTWEGGVLNDIMRIYI
jgi:hypothetical protein